jgi:hypothetical protein
MDIEQTGLQTIITVFISFIVILAIFLSLTWVGWKREGRRGDTCPYTHEPMRLGVDVAASLNFYVNAFLQEQERPNNPDIDFGKAAYCPKTGRIFPNCVQAGEQISLSWNFIQKRYKGAFVSWGSMSPEEQGVVKLLHESVDEFQTEKSSPKLRPEDVEEEYALTSPGPLYIDKATRVLMGWKKVPGTYFEVLVVQSPTFQTLEETI